jgi:PAS domain S-box-containing protein
VESPNEIEARIENLMVTEATFRDLVELSQDAFAIQCEDRIIYLNPAGAVLLGIGKVDKLPGKSVWDFIPRRYMNIVERRCRQMLEEGTTAAPIEMEIIRLDGRSIDVEVTAIPFTFSGKPALQVVFHDTTTRKAVEEQIRQRNIELSTLNAIAATVSQTLDLKMILDDSLEDILHLDMLGGDAQGMIFLREDDRDILALAAHRGAPENHPCLQRPPRIGECLCGLAVQLGEPVLSENCHTDARHTRSWPDMPNHKDVCLPLKVHGNVLGAMVVRLPESKEIGQNVVDLLSSVADQVSVAIENAKLFAEVAQQSETLRVLGGRLAQAEDAERLRLARELHDQVGESLTALGINLNIIRSQLTTSETEDLHRYLDDSLNLVERTTERIRGVMSELRPPMLDDYGLVAALRWYCERFSSRVGVDVVVQGTEPVPRFPSTAESALFRIATEALTNVAKHAQASQVTVTVTSDRHLLKLVITDNGIGFDSKRTFATDPPRGWGLLTMSERAEIVGGNCRVESLIDNGGTRVIAEVPR